MCRTALVVASLVLVACSAPRGGLGGADLGAGDLGANDLGGRDLGAGDLGADDLGASDFGPPDVGPMDAGCPAGTYDIDHDASNGCEYACTPRGAEVCNGFDDDCDGVVDGPGVPGWGMWYVDGDFDGHGASTTVAAGCAMPVGYVTSNDDCNDASAAIHPGAPELCNGVDDDCDGVIDDGASCGACTVAMHGGHTYLVCNLLVGWATAEATCVGFGYHLATIEDAGEDGWVSSTARTTRATGWWVGFNDQAHHGTWVWTAGTSTYTGWGPGEPSSGNEHCTLDAWTGGTAGSWNNGDCTLPFPFVCEVPP